MFRTAVGPLRLRLDPTGIGNILFSRHSNRGTPAATFPFSVSATPLKSAVKKETDVLRILTLLVLYLVIMTTLMAGYIPMF